MGGFRAAQKAVRAAGQAALPTKLCWRGCPRGLDFWRIPATRQEALVVPGSFVRGVVYDDHLLSSWGPGFGCQPEVPR